MNETKLFRDMTPDEQTAYAKQLSAWADQHLPAIEQAKGSAWTVEMVHTMRDGLALLTAWPFARDFCDKAVRYGDYSARAYRLRFYIDKINSEIARIAPAAVPAGSPAGNKRKPGRPASEATIARREAEAKAAKQQVEMFKPTEPLAEATDMTAKVGVAMAATVPTVGAAVPAGCPTPTDAAQSDYRLSIAQKRMLLSPDLAKRTEDIRTLRGQMAAAAEKAKTLAELNRSQKEIEAAAKESIEANDAVQAIFAEIDTELAVTWYRLQNDSDEWRKQWLTKHGYIKPNSTVPAGSPAGIIPDDLKHDLRKHYEKVKSPEFDLRCRTLIEQESPEYVAKQKAEAEKKKEVQDILRYLKRKDKGKSVETSRAKFRRLEELLGKKEAANYKPLLTKIEDDYKQSQKQETK